MKSSSSDPPPRAGESRPSDLREFGLGYPGTDLRRQLVAAVLSGAKTATAGLAGDEPPSAVGERYVVEDENGQPRAIVEITEARVIPASEIDLAFAQDEGEGFESVDDWRSAHERFFEQPIEPGTLIEAIRFRVVERL